MVYSNNEVIYIGETKDLQSRLKSHSQRSWTEAKILFSFSQSIELSESHIRHEIEVDLIGAYFAENNRVPIFQYGQTL
ncbi:MAG: GIY-YIG nuclease family protein [Vibrio sp.]